MKEERIEEIVIECGVLGTEAHIETSIKAIKQAIKERDEEIINMIEEESQNPTQNYAGPAMRDFANKLREQA
jgi:hypothetical protein